MTTPSPADASLALGSKIGRYFGIVSMLPALFLVVWTTALLKSDSWRTTPDPNLLALRMGNWSLAGIAWVLVATVLVALFLHPLQFAMTQLLEGYWGSSRLAALTMQVRISHYRKRYRKLANRRDRFADRREKVFNDRLHEKFEETVKQGTAVEGDDPEEWDDDKWDRRRTMLLAGPTGDPFMGESAAERAANAVIERYPALDRVMPTRLGNALRSVEDKAGRQYGIDAILTAPHLTLVAAERHVQYVRDSRQQMDTSVRLCTVSVLATVLSFAALLTDGWWLCVALAPHACAYLAYRAAISAAAEYTTAVSTVIDLDRFALYESLRIDIPKDSQEERAVNAELMELLGGNEDANVQYTQPPAPARKRRPYLGKPKKT
jgi:hypothetical protein